MATDLGEDLYAEWDDDGDLHLYTSEDGDIDEASAEIWLNHKTVEHLQRFISHQVKAGGDR